jgi:hypothetical protein
MSQVEKPSFHYEERFPSIIKNDEYAPSELQLAIFRAVPALFLYGVTLVSIWIFFYAPNVLFAAGVLASLYGCHYALTTAIFGLMSLNTVWKALETDYKQLYLNYIKDEPSKDKTAIHVNRSSIGWDDVIHYVIMPNYKEHVSVLNDTLEALARCKLASSHVIVVLAMEEREDGCEKKALDLIQQHQKNFKDITYTIHPANVPNEMAGKSSNDNYCLKTFAARMDPRLKDRAVITVADADSALHKLYFEAVTAKFLMLDEFDRHNRMFQPIVTPYRNTDSVPVVTRVAAQFSGVFELSSAADPTYHHMSYSTYSASLRFLEMYEAWDPNVICEDTHTYVTSYFLSGGKTSVDPIFLPVSSFCVESNSYLSSIYERYVQASRHAFGMCEIVFCLKQIHSNYVKFGRFNLPIIRTLTLLWRLTTPHMIPPIQLIFMVLPSLYIQFFGASSEIIMDTWKDWFLQTQKLSFVFFFFTYLASFLFMRTVTGNSYNVFHFCRFYIEWLIIGPVTTCIIGAIPCYGAATKLINSETFVYITAAKPDIGQTKPA